jgi:hypothetical protein
MKSTYIKPPLPKRAGSAPNPIMASIKDGVITCCKFALGLTSTILSALVFQEFSNRCVKEDDSVMMHGVKLGAIFIVLLGFNSFLFQQLYNTAPAKRNPEKPVDRTPNEDLSLLTLRERRGLPPLRIEIPSRDNSDQILIDRVQTSRAAASQSFSSR